jgi:hypothetical protein
MLVRTRLGPFTLAEAVPWSVVREGDAAALRARVLPMDRAVAHLPAVPLDAGAAERLRHGQRLTGREADTLTAAIPPGPCRLYAGETFLGIGEAAAGGLRAPASCMRIIRGLDRYPADAPPCVCAGHVRRHPPRPPGGDPAGGRAARARRLQAVALTFDPLPMVVFRPAEAPAEIPSSTSDSSASRPSVPTWRW